MTRRLMQYLLKLSESVAPMPHYYSKMYSLKKTFAFTVTSDFPKIIRSYLPLGIYETSYSIEISAVENFIIELEQILGKI